MTFLNDFYDLPAIDYIPAYFLRQVDPKYISNFLNLEDCENSDLDEKQRKRKNIERKNIMKIRVQRLWRTQQILPQSQLQL